MRTTDVLLALALVAAFVPARAQSGSRSRSRTPETVIREALVDSAKEPARPVEACVAELVDAGKAVIPGLVDALAGAEIDARQEAIVLGALERFGRGDLNGRIERLLDRGAPPAVRRGGYRLLATLGTRQDLPLLCGALRRPDPEADPDREEAGWFQSAVARILKRDELGFPQVRTLLHGQPGPIRFYLVGALADTETPAALEILSAELRSRPEENVWLLTECSRIAATVEPPVDEAIPSSIRVHLHSDDAMEVRAAAECLGRVEDFDSVRDLMALLEHPHPDVRRAALEALRSITGADLLPSSERWTAWLRAESAWFEASEPRLADDLAGSDSLRKMAAIRELAGHPFHRRESTRLLARALAHETDDLVRVGCAALRQLHDFTALPFLGSCAESSSKAVADEARAAIEAIRGTRFRPAPAR